MAWDENLTYLAIKKDTVDVKSKKPSRRCKTSAA
jgi:hypothetical protein